jgi:endogenous inhibitor of DNA gyrase (YacG/DUF329 family)
MINLSDYNIYTGKDGRVRAYNKKTHKGISYPRLIMENVLGRKLLPTEDVHHIDGNPQNNNIENLEVIDHVQHTSMHGGHNKKYDPIEKVCPVCNKEFIWSGQQQVNFYTHKNKYGPFCSKRCTGIYCAMKQYNNDSFQEISNLIIRKCPICGKEFIQSKASFSRYKNDVNKFSEPVCSSKCRFEYTRRFDKNSKTVG